MCGITGIWRLDGAAADPEPVRRMAAALAHRGPEGLTEAGTGPVRFAHRELSFVAGQQPLQFGPVLLCFNGEIYNFVELRRQLQLPEASEARLIAELYVRFGEQFPRHLEGMFAIALWDASRQRLLLARDPFGIKPLHYTLTSRQLAFASELKGLLADPQFKSRLSLLALDQYCSYGTVLEPACIFEGVHKVEPGTVHVVEAGGTVSSVPFAEFGGEPGDPEQVWTELQTSVRRCLRTPEPLAVWLSGGLDSSSVAFAVAQASGGVRTISAGFELPDWDERPLSSKIAAALGAEHHEVVIRESEARSALESLSAGLDEPLADCSALACFLLARESRTLVKGVLTGDGGDELFGGYPWHQARGRYAGCARPFLAHLGWSLFSEAEKEQLYRDPLRNRSFPLVLPLDENYLRGCSGLEASLHIDQRTVLLSRLLVKVDRTTMLHGLEARLPFLNCGVAQAARALPEPWKHNKRALRVHLERALPAEVLSAPKRGFGLPVGVWLWKPGPLRELLNEVVLSDESMLWQWFRPEFARSLLRDHDRTLRQGSRLWALLVFELWLRAFGKRAVQAGTTSRTNPCPNSS